jgi:PPOX class probable F420-dependent enzyme
VVSSLETLAVPESHRDLLDTDVAILATVGRDRFPQVSAVWFLLDDDGVLKLSLNKTRQKAKNLSYHRECTLFFLDRANPYRTLEIRAGAALHPDDDYSVAERVGRKYGVDLRTMDRPGERRVAVILHPVKINATDLRAPAAAPAR